MSDIRGGHTLPEVLLATTLTMLVLGLAYQLLAAFWGFGSTLAARAEIQQMGAIALGRLASDVRRSALPGASLDTGVLGLVGLLDVDSMGHQVWDEQVTLYYRAGSRLLRRDIPASSIAPEILSSDRPTRLSLPTLHRLAGDFQAKAICLADCVTEFEVSLAGPDHSAQPLTVTLKLARILPSGRRERLELARDLYLRNSP